MYTDTIQAKEQDIAKEKNLVDSMVASIKSLKKEEASRQVRVVWTKKTTQRIQHLESPASESDLPNPALIPWQEGEEQ